MKPPVPRSSGLPTAVNCGRPDHNAKVQTAPGQVAKSSFASNADCHGQQPVSVLRERISIPGVRSEWVHIGTSTIQGPAPETVNPSGFGGFAVTQIASKSASGLCAGTCRQKERCRLQSKQKMRSVRQFLRRGFRILVAGSLVKRGAAKRQKTLTELRLAR